MQLLQLILNLHVIVLAQFLVIRLLFNGCIQPVASLRIFNNLQDLMLNFVFEVLDIAVDRALREFGRRARGQGLFLLERLVRAT